MFNDFMNTNGYLTAFVAFVTAQTLIFMGAIFIASRMSIMFVHVRISFFSACVICVLAGRVPLRYNDVFFF